ncbi:MULTISPECIES: DUF1176 domain-containing protein [unclassified Pseudomonas]|uniref:DUF1176 domain-containing protein n=1 Tax=unclassified Pseudomonas TaxID=196821 RepID=UPI001E3FF9CA|nr:MULTISPECIES: DUF1176 domain-containing protein [unclassified Pseudomonas]MCE0915200.1 DUF1176 domain-containing protein [Pseudomonas sp. NMI760_13]MCP8631878.1 DUF1176 domain-containing protein [Pseudomonas sp. DVZ6]MDD7784842.1 DUF1176 domain-containing protein [Pseudomonas sp. DVZ24]
MQWMKRHRAALLLALMAPLAAQAESDPAALEAVPLYRQVKDWAVGCDNTRACTALLAIDDELMSGLQTIVRREAGPQGKLELTLRVGPAFADQVLLDGQELSAQWRRIQGEYDFDLQLEGDAALALIRQIRNGNRLSSLTEDGELVASLQGISGALLAIDAVQGRVGHADALVRVGDVPAAEVPDAPVAAALPQFVAAPGMSDEQAHEIGRTVKRQAGVEGDVPGLSFSHYEVYPLDADSALVILNVGYSGEFCANYLYRVSRAAPYQISEMAFEAPTPLLAPQLSGHVTFDPQSGQLQATDKSLLERGCGLVQQWRYDGQRMRLERVARLDRCGYVKPEFWPVLWRLG